MDAHDDKRDVVPLGLAVGESGQFVEDAIDDLDYRRVGRRAQQALKLLQPPELATAIFHFGDAIRVCDEEITDLKLKCCGGKLR